MKFGLGTVQFGQAYGISNVRGVTPTDEARAILRKAAEAGISVVDTAPRYGDAERVLGTLGYDLQGLQVVTKTPLYVNGEDRGSQVAKSVQASLATMGLPRVYGLLEHHAASLLDHDGKALWKAFCRERDAGHVDRVGVSIYAPVELDAIHEHYAIDLVQFPLNIIDRRMLARERLKRLADLGVEIHVRSAFLQGALLAPPERAAAVPGLSRLVERFQKVCAAHDVTPLEGALAFLQSIPEIDVVLVGVEDVRQLEQILAVGMIELDPKIFDAISCDDPTIVDPSRWGIAK